MSTADEDSVARRAFLGKVAAGTLATASAPLLAASAKLPNAAADDPWLKCSKASTRPCSTRLSSTMASR